MDRESGRPEAEGHSKQKASKCRQRQAKAGKGRQRQAKASKETQGKRVTSERRIKEPNVERTRGGQGRSLAMGLESGSRASSEKEADRPWRSSRTSQPRLRGCAENRPPRVPRTGLK
ncbi:hypothetical protein BDV09DRAFT_65932 [Aspergillus tetrazonus]